MEIGTCPRCTRPYTASELAGFGILRPRSAAAGGPLLEFICPDCRKKLRLIPHGDGRYALPGKPPPEFVPVEERRPPWVAAEPQGAEAPQDPGAPPQPPEDIPRPPPAREPAAREPAARKPAAGESTPDDGRSSDGRLTVAKALEILGCAASASKDEIDRAFRERSRTCHPDKVAHLDDEFQALAESKFKRLRAAYDLLR